MTIKKGRVEIVVGPFHFPASQDEGGVILETGSVLSWIFVTFFAPFWDGSVVVHDEECGQEP